MAKYVCSSAKLKCSMGSQESALNVIHPTKPVLIQGEPMAGIMDHKTMVNIQPFGECKSLANPTVAAATAAANGKLQKMPCIPNTASPWVAAKMSVLVKGRPALLESSKLMCVWAGVIEITDPGQNTVQEGHSPPNAATGAKRNGGENATGGVFVNKEKGEEKENSSEEENVKDTPIEKEAKKLTVKDFVEILEKIESKQGYEAARHYASNHIDYWKINKLAESFVKGDDDNPDNDPNIMPTRFMILYGADDGKLKIDKHHDDFASPPEHEVSVTNLRRALILLGYDIEENGSFDDAVYFAFLNHLGRYGRIDLNRIYEDEKDKDAPLDRVADIYGVSTWKYFYDGDHREEIENHERIIKRLDHEYGDELLREKGVEPYTYLPGICYHYPWEPFRMKVNLNNKYESGKEAHYEIVDRGSLTLLAEGSVCDQGKVETLLPNAKEILIYIDGVKYNRPRTANI